MRLCNAGISKWVPRKIFPPSKQQLFCLLNKFTLVPTASRVGGCEEICTPNVNMLKGFALAGDDSSLHPHWLK